MSDAQKKIEQIKYQVNYQITMDLIAKLQERCFEECIHEPGTSFSGQQKECLTSCIDRFREARSLVHHSVSDILENQKAK